MSEALRWDDLSESERFKLQGKLAGLYEQARDKEAFDKLSVDKQQAILLFARRLDELDLWDTVRTITNAYGEGGVGFGFISWPFLRSTLDRRRDFTKLLARHRDCEAGFIERHQSRAALHFLLQSAKSREWTVHFDLYNPVSSKGFFAHLVYERIKGHTPNWRVIRESLQSP